MQGAFELPVPHDLAHTPWVPLSKLIRGECATSAQLACASREQFGERDGAKSPGEAGVAK